ncbi:cupin domain-containing protein [uncultured Streptomyces sp.]|uniref:cupin domain-containing protein n=1 Tax=uncultured Streptomyces sp. TaxID=174707 RepID=UPI002639FE46|nr:cupin domain-containing protein [uncultured Streptomyces sp.]
MSGHAYDGVPRAVRGTLPHGVEIYHLRPDGRVVVGDRHREHELGPAGELLRFIDDGQFAHYLVGDAATSPERPSNATVKLGVVRPRSAFTPHAHGGEHFVLSLGHAACGLYDAERGTTAEVPLSPGMLIRIPEMMPHSFANRGGLPLTILTANTGFGIDHEDYAITAADARRRAGESGPAEGAAEGPEGRSPVATAAPPTTDFLTLAAALESIEERQRTAGIARTTVRERLAARLRRVATALEARP